MLIWWKCDVKKWSEIEFEKNKEKYEAIAESGLSTKLTLKSFDSRVNSDSMGVWNSKISLFKRILTLMYYFYILPIIHDLGRELGESV